MITPEPYRKGPTEAEAIARLLTTIRELRDVVEDLLNYVALARAGEGDVMPVYNKAHDILTRTKELTVQ